jgi:hypothetical protein
MNKQIDYQSVFHLIISHSHCPEAYPFHIICPFFHIFFFVYLPTCSICLVLLFVVTIFVAIVVAITIGEM